MAYDIEPLNSMEERAYWNKKMAAGNWLLFLEHDNAIECTQVAVNERGVYQSGQKGTLASLL
jgi:hypothetical protein